ncbi:N-acetylglucosamine kinase [Persicitalea sp.]|uniref:N-acetylglucosamine kinase n=1 Tax=Persicitalea sp. TaxID=3100273 RepID=UPI0035938299
MILLADSGSTKTDWLLLDEDGQQITRFASVGFNPFYQTQAVIAEGLRNEVVPKVSGQVREVHFYGAGCADEKTSRPACDALTDGFPDATIAVHSDLLAAARGLCGRQPGIACILGTGSNNCLYDGEKIVNNIGSLGFWLGDEGSGGYLGKRLVTHYLHGELPTEIYEAFRTSYPDVARLSILDRAYKQPFPNRYFATFAPFLSQYLDRPFIRNLVQDAFHVFLDIYVVRHPGSGALPLHFTGSVAHYFESVLKEAMVKKGLQLGSIQKSPMLGLARYHIAG